MNTNQELIQRIETLENIEIQRQQRKLYVAYHGLGIGIGIMLGILILAW